MPQTRMVPQKALLALAEAAGYRNSRSVQQLITELYLDPDEEDAEEANELVQDFSLEAKLKGREGHPLLPSPPLKEMPQEGIEIGRIPNYRDRVFIPIWGHKYLAGVTRAGKTTLAESIVVEARRLGLDIIIFDPEGAQFPQHLAGLFPMEDIYVVDAENYLVVPDDPPSNLTQKEWIGIMANIDREAWYYRRGAENFSLKVKLTMLGEGKRITLPGYYQEILASEPKGRDWREHEYYLSVKTTVETMMNFLDNLCVDRSRGLREIFSRPLVIFDWSRLQNSSFKKYLTMHAAWWLIASRISEDRPVDTLLVFDEVSQLASLDLERQVDNAEPFFQHLLRTSRRKGFSVMTLDQDPALTHPVVRANSSTKIIMTLDEGRDKAVMAADFDLNPEQRAYLSAIKRRQAIVKLPEIAEPFLVEIREVGYEEANAGQGN